MLVYPTVHLYLGILQFKWVCFVTDYLKWFPTIDLYFIFTGYAINGLLVENPLLGPSLIWRKVVTLTALFIGMIGGIVHLISNKGL